MITDQSRPATGPGSLMPLLALGNFAIGMGAFVVVGIIDPLTAGLRIDRAAASQVLTIYAIAYAVSSPLLVALTGRLARRTVLATGLLVFLAGVLGCALAPNLPALLTARMVTALGAGIFTPSTAAVAIATSAPDQRGRALATVFSGLTLSQVAGVPVGSWIGFTFGWQAAFIAVAILSLVALIGIIWLVPAAVPFQPTGLVTLGRTLIDPKAAVAVLLTTTFLGSAYVVFTFLAALLKEKHGLERDGVTLVLVLYGLGAVVGNMVGGRLAQAIGPFRTLLILGLAQCILIPLVTFQAFGVVTGTVLLMLWAVSTWSFMAPQQMRLVTLVPNAQNVILALNASAIYVGAALGSSLAAGSLPYTGLTGLGLTGGLCALAAVAHLLLSHWQVGRSETA